MPAVPCSRTCLNVQLSTILKYFKFKIWLTSMAIPPIFKAVLLVPWVRNNKLVKKRAILNFLKYLFFICFIKL